MQPAISAQPVLGSTPDAAAIVAALSSHRFRHTTERELGDGIAALFTRRGWGFEREAWLSTQDRIDFLVGTVGIELKTNGGSGSVAAQLLRYTGSDSIRALILVTTRSQLCMGLPSQLGGRSLHIVNLSGSGL